jgi:SAM-dependent methyltransferase
VASHFHVRDGDLVGDFGAGSGAFLPALSKKVGETGRVFACEIQRGLVDKIGTLIHTERLHNVDPLWCDLESENGIKIPDGCLDVAIVVNTLFQLEERERAITEKRRTLRSGGVLYLVDWSESFGGAGPHPDCVICKQLAIDLFEAAGFIFEREYPCGDYHYGLAFRAL